MCKLEFFRVTQRKHHKFLYVIFLQMQCLIKCGYIGAFWKGPIKMILLFLVCTKKDIFWIPKISPYLELANFGRLRWKRLCSQKKRVYTEIPSLTATSHNYQEQDCQNFWPRKSTLSKLYFESYCWQIKILLLRCQLLSRSWHFQSTGEWRRGVVNTVFVLLSLHFI